MADDDDDAIARSLQLLEQRKENLEDVSRNLAKEYTLANKQLQSKLNGYLLDPALLPLPPSAAGNRTDFNKSEAGDNVSDEVVTRFVPDRGLVELLSQANRTSWTSDDLCKADPLKAQDWFRSWASIEPSKQLQLACELLNIRDCAGYRLRPALEVYKLTELPGFQPGSVVSPGEPCCRSVTSMDSFFDSTEQHTFKAWKELCIVLDKTLKQKLQEVISGAIQADVLPPIVQRLASLHGVLGTAEYVWHVWTELRCSALAITFPQSEGLHHDTVNLSSTIDQHYTMLPLDIAVVQVLFPASAMKMLSDFKGPGGRILSELVSLTRQITAVFKSATSNGVSGAGAGGDGTSNAVEADGSVGNAGGGGHGDTVHPHLARMFTVQSTSVPQPDGDDSKRSGVFPMLCILFGKTSQYAQALNDSTAELDHEKGRSDGGLTKRKPQSPRPNPNRVLQPFTHATTAAGMTVVEEGEEDDESPRDFTRASFTGTSLSPIHSTAAIGKTSFRRSRDVWEWTAKLSDHQDTLADQMSVSIIESGNMWLQAEKEWSRSQLCDNLALGKFFPSPGSACLSTSTMRFFKECKVYSTLALIPMPHGFSRWKPRDVFVEKLELCLQKVLDHVKEVCSNVPSQYTVTSLYYCWSLLMFAQKEILDYDCKIAGKYGSQRYTFLSSKAKLKVVAGDLLDCIQMQEGSKLRCSLFDELSQDWNSQKSYFKSEKVSYPIDKYCQDITGLLYKIECCGALCRCDGQLMLAQLLSTSLSQITARYTHLKPTFKRVPLFRSDIQHLLCTVHSLIWYILPLLTSSDGSLGVSHVTSIHASCCILYSTLMTHTLPIPDLVKAITSGGALHTVDTQSDNDGGYGDDARDTVQSFEHKVLWIIHLHQNDLSLNQRALSMAMTWYFHLATGSMLAPSLSTSTTLCHSLVSLLTVKNFEFSTSLLKLVLGSLLDAQKSGECGDLLQAVAYQQFIWPLYSILKCTRSTMVMKELVASSREEESDFLIQPYQSSLDTPLPLWFSCFRDDVDRELLRNLPSLLLDMALAGPEGKSVISLLPCGCSSPPGPEKELTVSMATNVIVHQLCDDLTTSDKALSACQLLADSTSLAVMLAALAQVVILKIGHLYTREMSVFLPQHTVKTELVQSIWSSLHPRKQLSHQGTADGPLRVLIPDQSGAKEDWTTMFEKLISTSCPPLPVKDAGDCYSNLECQYSSEVAVLSRSLVESKDIFEVMVLSKAHPLEPAEYPYEKMTKYLQAQMQENQNGKTIASSTYSSTFCSDPCSRDCISPVPPVNWKSHLSMVLAISPGQLMASLLKNRFEWWDKAAPLSAADHEAQATLKDFERQHEEQ